MMCSCIFVANDYITVLVPPSSFPSCLKPRRSSARSSDCWKANRPSERDRQLAASTHELSVEIFSSALQNRAAVMQISAANTQWLINISFRRLLFESLRRFLELDYIHCSPRYRYWPSSNVACRC
jgi:hypothetical protein